MFNFTYRQGTSIARGTTVDEYLTDAQNKKLYTKWDNSWGEPFYFRGGEVAITFEMILEAPKDAFVKAMGKKMGTELLELASEYAGR